MAAVEGSFVAVGSAEHPVPHESSDDEDSFVVLENSSPSINGHVSSTPVGEVLPPLRTNKVHDLQNLLKKKIEQISSDEDTMPELPTAVNTIETVTASVARITISPDSSYEEIQKQVEDLIKENETLKNTIAQNNMSMKTQYERFVAYRDDVNKVLKSYKDKISEAKVYLDKYKDENLKLASENEIYLNLKKLHEEEIINLKERIRMQESTGFVPVKTEETELNGSAKILDLQTQLAEVNFKVSELNNEKTELQVRSQKFKEEIHDMQTKLNEATHKILCVNEEKEKLTVLITELEQKLDVKRNEVEKLTEKLVAHTPKLEEQVETKQQEINILQFDVSSLRTEVTRLKNENEAMKQQLQNTTQQSEEFHLLTATSVSALELQVQQKDAEVKGLTTKLEEIKVRDGRLSKENTAIAAELAEAKKDFYQIRSQLSIAQQTITALNTEQENKAQEIEKLRKLIQESQDKNDELYALKEQLDVYKNDFEEEKRSKKALEEERGQLVKDLQDQQRRNKQLQNEVETLRARVQPRDEGYSCPKCSFGFSSYQSLENHVHRCLDLDGIP